jgi:hypothetical protein
MRPPRSAITLVKMVGTPKAFAVLARAVALFTTICGSWLFRLVS